MGVGAAGIRPPETGRIFTGHNNRIADVERQVASQAASQRPASRPFEVVFGGPDPLAASTSLRFSCRWSARLNVVLFSLDTVGSDDSEFHVLRNGVALTPLGRSGGITVAGTLITLASYEHTGKAFFDQVFSVDDDYLQLELVTAGTDAAALTCQARFG